jgi:membrane-bound serine protease (ClpP class)
LRSLVAFFFGITLLGAPLAAAPEVIAVNLNGVIHPITVEILSSAIQETKQKQASLLLIRLNTPGGLVESTRQIVEKIVASPVPVVAYVTPSGGRAASAGFFILAAGDIAAMAPGTNTGAAHPVLMGTQMDPVMKQKVENDAAAFLRSIAAKRGRNAELAEKAVRESRSFTDKEALDNRLIDLVAPSEQELLSKLDGKEISRFSGNKQTLRTADAVVHDYQKSIRQKILSAIADPNLALVLLVLGALGIYAEFSAPGLILPGVAGSIMVLLGLSAISVLPINWLGAALMVLALALFVLEAKFASHGILGIGGTLSMILGALLLIDSPIPELRIRLSTAVAVALPFAAITMLLVTLVIRARRNKVVTGNEGMIGETGVVLTPLAPEGKILVHGEYWGAVSPVPLEVGVRVRVTAVNGLSLTVEPLPDHTGVRNV